MPVWRTNKWDTGQVRSVLPGAGCSVILGLFFLGLSWSFLATAILTDTRKEQLKLTSVPCAAY